VAVASQPVELYEEPRARKLARIGLWTGLASVVLLVAAIRFAHHWNPVSLAIVTAWGTATLVAFGSSARAVARSTRSRRLAKWGLALCSISLLALVITGIAFAAGGDPAGACGGG
jgi:putative flippase GtrA